MQVYEKDYGRLIYFAGLNDLLRYIKVDHIREEVKKTSDEHVITETKEYELVEDKNGHILSVNRITWSEVSQNLYSSEQ
ncbi:hypothetical protein [Aneurinibacillus thermoaerophilus]|uniref:hypothetical protein n=1 Tax=Aneurinibacillus thermoaerophilus TaxID=143495 RepID=UPI002E21120E|nr:hypothetical protein [Aneurinibacillus thermoaerophilus]